MQSLSLVNQFLTEFSYSQSTLKTQTPLQGKDLGSATDSVRNSLTAGVTVELTYSKTEFSYSSSSNTASRGFSLQMMETRLSGQLQSFARLGDPPKIFPSAGPSPENVADRILGFVANRIDKEAQAGASDEQLSRMFAEGLAGVNQGYGEAIEEIEQRNLMTDSLAAEIDAGYSLIESGFEKLREKYLGNGGLSSKTSGDRGTADEKNVAESVAEATNGVSPTTNGVSSAPVPPSEEAAPAVDNLPRRSRLAEAFAADRSQYTANNVGITVTTQDGDQVRISVGEQTAERALRGGTGETEARSLAYSQSSFQLDRLNLQIEGNLDDGEIKALESLLIQVEDIADSFFGGDLEKAFEAALEMDVDMSEIASYALSMSSLRYQAVETAYQQRQTEVEAFKPLTRLVPLFAGALADAAEFSRPRQLLNDLFDKTLQTSGQSENPNLNLFNKFRNSVVEKLSY